MKEAGGFGYCRGKIDRVLAIIRPFDRAIAGIGSPLQDITVLYSDEQLSDRMHKVVIQAIAI